MRPSFFKKSSPAPIPLLTPFRLGATPPPRRLFFLAASKWLLCNSSGRRIGGCLSPSSTDGKMEDFSHIRRKEEKRRGRITVLAPGTVDGKKKRRSRNSVGDRPRKEN